jgi:hypothetical protein
MYSTTSSEMSLDSRICFALSKNGLGSFSGEPVSTHASAIVWTRNAKS